jgi:hypothetical protein
VECWEDAAGRLLNELNARLSPEEQICVEFSTTEGYAKGEEAYFRRWSPDETVGWISRVSEQNREGAVRF